MLTQIDTKQNRQPQKIEILVPNRSYPSVQVAISQSYVITTSLKCSSIALETPAGVMLGDLESCRKLQELHLRGCYKVGDPGLAALGRLASLTLLNLQECWQITAAGVAGLSG